MILSCKTGYSDEIPWLDFQKTPSSDFIWRVYIDNNYLGMRTARNFEKKIASGIGALKRVPDYVRNYSVAIYFQFSTSTPLEFIIA